MREVKVKGHAHSTNKHWYRKVDGVWKFAGLAPDIRWGEFDFDKVFADGRDELGEKEPVKRQEFKSVEDVIGELKLAAKKVVDGAATVVNGS